MANLLSGSVLIMEANLDRINSSIIPRNCDRVHGEPFSTDEWEIREDESDLSGENPIKNH